MHELVMNVETEGEREREICVLCLWDETVQSAGCKYKGKRTIGILCNQWGRDDVNFKYEATFAFDLDAKWNYRKSCLSSAADLFVFPWCREKHHRNTESLELDTLNLTESMNASRSIYLFLSSYHYLSTNGVAPPTTISKQTTNNPFNY